MNNNNIRKGFLPFLLSQFVSLIGDRVSSLAFVSLAAGIAVQHGGAAASNVAVAQIVPIFLLSHLGGVWADLMPRKWIMVWVDIGRLVTLSVTIILFALYPRLEVIYIGVFVLGAMTALFNPSKRSFIPFLVVPEMVRRANWWMALSEVAAMLLGLGLGTLLLNLYKPTNVLWLDAMSFMVAIGILFAIPEGMDKVTRAGTTSRMPGLREGWQTVRDNPALSGIFLWIVAPFFISAGLFYAGANYWAAERSPSNAGAMLGQLLLALSCGALASFFIRRWLERWGERLGAILALGFCSGMIVLSALAQAYDSFSLLFSCVFLTGIGVGLVYVRTTYLIHLIAGEEMVGRLIGFKELLGAFGFAATVGLTGLAADIFNATLGWLLSAVVLLIGMIGLMNNHHQLSKVEI